MNKETNRSVRATAIIIGSADIIKLGLIRSLGVVGCKIIAIHLVNTDLRKIYPYKPLDYYSKYVSAYHFVKRNELVDFLLKKYADETNKPILFTLDDASVYIIDEAYNRMENKFHFSNCRQEKEGIILLMDKNVQKTLAARAGLNVPKGWIIKWVNGSYNIPNDIQFPCFVKGMLCYYGTKKLQRCCNSESELKNLLKQNTSCFPYPLIAEQFIPNAKEIGVIGLCINGECIIPAKLEKVAGKGSVNGVTMYGNLIPLDDKDVNFVPLRRFIKSLNYTGIINLDLIENNDKLYFLEANFRYAAYGYGLALADVNLPALYVDMINGESKNIKLTRVKRFFNEKIAAKNVIEGLLSWEQYKMMKNESDFCAIKSKDDPVPYRHFKVRYTLLYIKSRIKKHLSIGR